MNGRHDEINITLNIFGDAVFLASNMGLASAGVCVLIILCLKNIFSFIDSDINMQLAEATRLLHAVRCNTGVLQPSNNGSHGYIAGCKCMCKFLCSPMFSIVAEFRMGSINQELVGLIEIILGDCNSEWEQGSVMKLSASTGMPGAVMGKGGKDRPQEGLLAGMEIMSRRLILFTVRSPLRRRSSATDECFQIAMLLWNISLTTRRRHRLASTCLGYMLSRVACNLELPVLHLILKALQSIRD